MMFGKIPMEISYWQRQSPNPNFIKITPASLGFPFIIKKVALWQPLKSSSLFYWYFFN